MRQASIRLTAFVPVVIVTLVLGLVFGVVLGTTVFANHSTAASPTPRKIAPLTTVTIPQGEDVFEPFILTVSPNTTVTWQNKDTVAHTIITTPNQNNFLNLDAFSLNVGPGQSVKFTLKMTGLYHYYDNTMAKWDTTDMRVAANKGVPHYPIAMDGVIWVQGPISNLPSGGTNRIPNNHDDFVTEFLAVNQGGTVSWHNFDTDPHFLAEVPDLQAPINPAELGINRIAGTDEVPGGDTVTLIFNTPGLYYYYCANHAKIDAPLHRAEALKNASEFPIPMEGFVLVVGN
jgi:plastocyanin